jgi:peptidoglycan/xylan/chitin deacetylase (PgdA/CDA1 family)
VWRGDRNRKVIYLTFDDGPVRGVTDLLLDILKKQDIKATFFCVGENIDKNPDLFHRIIREGHAAGNHTYHHLDGWKSRENVYLADIQKCKETMIRYGYSSGPGIFRPPYGRLKKKTIRKIGKEYRIIMWDVLSYDFSTCLDRNTILKKSIGYTEGGSIIIFHDSEKTKRTIPFLISQYIDHFIGHNYEFSTIDRLILPN